VAAIGGTPLPDVVLSIERSTVPASTVTGSDGTSVVAGLAPGQYTVTAAVPDYMTSSAVATVTANATATVQLRLAPLGSISGTVRNAATGLTVPHVVVEVRQGETPVADAMTWLPKPGGPLDLVTNWLGRLSEAVLAMESPNKRPAAAENLKLVRQQLDACREAFSRIVALIQRFKVYEASVGTYLSYVRRGEQYLAAVEQRCKCTCPPPPERAPVAGSGASAATSCGGSCTAGEAEFVGPRCRGHCAPPIPPQNAG
jgi:hypothetical protein